MLIIKDLKNNHEKNNKLNLYDNKNNKVGFMNINKNKKNKMVINTAFWAVIG